MHNFKSFYLKELGDAKDFEWHKEGKSYNTVKKIEDQKVEIYLVKKIADNKYVLEIGFMVNDFHGKKGEGKANLRVLTTVISAIKDAFPKFIEPDKEIKSICFTSFSSRADDLYTLLAKKIEKETGWKYSFDGEYWNLNRPEEEGDAHG
jgi:hypothetical protein